MKCNHPNHLDFKPAEVAQGSMRPKAVLTKMQQLVSVQLMVSTLILQSRDVPMPCCRHNQDNCQVAKSGSD